MSYMDSLEEFNLWSEDVNAGDVIIPESWEVERQRNAAHEFQNKHKDYKPCSYNAWIIGKFILERELDFNLESIERAWSYLKRHRKAAL